MLSDPTVIPLTIVLLILVTIAVIQNLNKIAGFLVFTYLLYLLILWARTEPDNYSVKHVQPQAVPVESIVSTEKESPSVQIGETFSDTLPSSLIETPKKQTYIPVFVNDLAMTKSIINRMPVDTNTEFYDTLGTLYCFTGVRNLNEFPQTIAHQWEYKNTFFSSVEIKVGRSYNWRCWSKISNIDKWPGAWKVFVLDSAGNKLDSIKFVIKKTIPMDQVSVQ